MAAKPLSLFALLISLASSSFAVSFDCAKARSVPEKLICSDQELSQLDDKLGALVRQAALDTPDISAFKRRNVEAWKQRERDCKDAICVKAWYEARIVEVSQLLKSAASSKTDDGKKQQAPVASKPPALQLAYSSPALSIVLSAELKDMIQVVNCADKAGSWVCVLKNKTSSSIYVGNYYGAGFDRAGIRVNTNRLVGSLGPGESAWISFSVVGYAGEIAKIVIQ